MMMKMCLWRCGVVCGGGGGVCVVCGGVAIHLTSHCYQGTLYQYQCQRPEIRDQSLINNRFIKALLNYNLQSTIYNLQLCILHSLKGACINYISLIMVLQPELCATPLCCGQPCHPRAKQHVFQRPSAAPHQPQSCGAAYCTQGQNLVAPLHMSECLAQWRLAARPHMMSHTHFPSSARRH